MPGSLERSSSTAWVRAGAGGWGGSADDGRSTLAIALVLADRSESPREYVATKRHNRRPNISRIQPLRRRRRLWCLACRRARCLLERSYGLPAGRVMADAHFSRNDPSSIREDCMIHPSFG